jgi:hypothetical protein
MVVALFSEADLLLVAVSSGANLLSTSRTSSIASQDPLTVILKF